ncbi:MAG: group 1 truncated hemoglobin [Oligoflexia bacterium]|nr:group 1 truncated hemoglobin [Oligoflexia bacterium]
MVKKLTQLYVDASGETGIEKILIRFYEKMAKDIMLGFFFDNKNLNHIIQQQKTFLLRAMGKNYQYFGKSPTTAHLEMPPILKGHFDRRVVLLRETLTEVGMREESIQTWIEFEENFRNAIVKEEGPIKK